MRHLLDWAPWPVQVAAVNDRVFLVNASVGLYPDLLENREAYKASFGRSSWVALWAACTTLLRAQRRLRLHIEQGAVARDVRTLTLFVGNNRLQLEQLGVHPQFQEQSGVVEGFGMGHITAVMLRPIGTLSMIRLMLSGPPARSWIAWARHSWLFRVTTTYLCLICGRAGARLMPGTSRHSCLILNLSMLHPTWWWCASTPRGSGGTNTVKCQHHKSNDGTFQRLSALSFASPSAKCGQPGCNLLHCFNRN